MYIYNIIYDICVFKTVEQLGAIKTDPWPFGWRFVEHMLHPPSTIVQQCKASLVLCVADCEPRTKVGVACSFYFSRTISESWTLKTHVY